MKIKKSQELNGIQVPKPFSREIRVIFSSDVDEGCGCNLIRATIYPFKKVVFYDAVRYIIAIFPTR